MDVDGVEQASLHLPSGPETLVLTVDSTWVREPEVMGAAVTRHDELLDEAIPRHGGVRRPADDEHEDQYRVVAAFTRASDAVAAALDVQRAAHSEGAPLRLRIALHTAQRRDDRLTALGLALPPVATPAGAYLAAVNGLVGLDAVVQVVKVVGFVASAPGFTAQPAVLNGASALLAEVFGAAGAHARSAVGVAELPSGVPVEIELVVEVS